MNSPFTRRRTAALTLGVLIACVAPLQAQRFRAQTAVTVIEVPVQVARDGLPVRGLTREDFVVTMGRDELPLVGFEVIDLALPRPGLAPAPVPINARRHFLFVFDLAYSRPSAILRARQAAREVVQTALHPSDLAAVALYSPTQGPILLLGFTSDRAQLEVAIETLGAKNLFNRRADPLGLVMADVAPGFQLIPGSPSAPGAPGESRRAAMESDVLSFLQEQAAQVDREEASLRERKVVEITSGLEAIADLLRTVEGRKHVVFLSDGIDSATLIGAGALDEGASQQRALDIMFGQSHLVSSNSFYGSTRAINALEGMLESFRRSDCAVHTVDLTGVRVGGDVDNTTTADAGFGDNADSLIAMAKDTGGAFFENLNDLGVAFDRLLERTRVTYLLAVQPPELPADGRFHKLKVRLRNASRGVELSHRPGFFAGRPPSVVPEALERRFVAAERILSGEPGGNLTTNLQALPLQVPGQVAYVPLVIEIDGPQLLQGAVGDEVKAEIYAYAIGEEGQVADFFQQNLDVDLAKLREVVGRAGIKFFGHLDLPPGQYEVRVLVQSPASDRHSLQVASVQVPANPGTTPSLLPPLFADVPGQWLVIREGIEQQQERPMPYPFLAGEAPYLPALAPRLRVGASSEVHLVGTQLGAQPKVEMTVLEAATGREVAEGVMPITTRGTGFSGGDHLATRFETSDLAAGSYVLQVRVTDTTTGLSQVTSATFDVVAAP